MERCRKRGKRRRGARKQKAESRAEQCRPVLRLLLPTHCASLCFTSVNCSSIELLSEFSQYTNKSRRDGREGKGVLATHTMKHGQIAVTYIVWKRSCCCACLLRQRSYASWKNGTAFITLPPREGRGRRRREDK